jgi:hypothetical protein
MQIMDLGWSKSKGPEEYDPSMKEKEEYGPYQAQLGSIFFFTYFLFIFKINQGSRF